MTEIKILVLRQMSVCRSVVLLTVFLRCEIGRAHV